MTTALLLAEEYGFPVFPCGPNKQPLTVHGFKDASTSIEIVGTWWDQYPDALTGIPTGKVSKLLVIDVDPDGVEWYRQNAQRLACGYVQNTRRGHHLFYQYPDIEIRNSASKIAPGIDVRGEGGYVIAWQAHGLPGAGSWDDIGPAPAWLIDALTKPDGAKQQHAVVLNGKAYPEGQRNDSLFRLGCRLRRSGLTAEEILAAIAKRNATHCSPPLSNAEVADIAESAGRYPEGGGHALHSAAEPDVPLFLTADMLRAGAFESSPPIIEGLLLSGATLVHGPAKKGKSWFLLQMALAIDGGERFLDRNVSRRECLYVGAEDTSARFKSRLERMFASGTLKFMNREALGVFAKRLQRSLGEDEHVTVEAAVAALWKAAGRPSVMIVDTQEVFEMTLGISHGRQGESITRRDYRATSSYDELAQRIGIAIVLVGHWGEIKSIEKATINPHECLNTTKARLAGVTTSITLGPLPNQEPGEATREMQLSVRSRDLEGGDQFLWLHQDEITGAYENKGNVRDVLVTEAQGQLFGVLMDGRKTHGGDHWMTAADLAEELDCSPQAVKQMVARVKRGAKAKGRKVVYQGFELESKPNKGYRLK